MIPTATKNNSSGGSSTGLTKTRMARSTELNLGSFSGESGSYPVTTKLKWVLVWLDQVGA